MWTRGLALLGLCALTLTACDPDLPGRGCATDDDCFSQERCLAKSCVPGATDEADAEPAGPDVGVESDFSADDPEPGADAEASGP